MHVQAKHHGKVALVTGASSGMGRTCSVHLQKLGFTVYGGSRSMQSLALPGIHCLTLDVDQDDSVQAAVSQVLAREQRLDLLLNCAGFGIAGALEDTSTAEAKAQFETNLFGTLRTCRAVLPHMRAQGSGLIINVSSLGGLIAIPFQGVYSASKFALEGLTECLRMEVAPFGVRVALIQPGDFATGFTAQRRHTQASQGASAYRGNCQRAIAQMEQDEQRGPAPQRIAELLERILAQPAPRLRYMSGPWLQRLAVPLKWLLPHRLFEKLMMSTYHIR